MKNMTKIRVENKSIDQSQVGSKNTLLLYSNSLIFANNDSDGVDICYVNQHLHARQLHHNNYTRQLRAIPNAHNTKFTLTIACITYSCPNNYTQNDPWIVPNISVIRLFQEMCEVVSICTWLENEFVKDYRNPVNCVNLFFYCASNLFISLVYRI